MGKRKKDKTREENEDYIKKKIRKYQRKLEVRSRTPRAVTVSPPPRPVPAAPPTLPDQPRAQQQWLTPPRPSPPSSPSLPPFSSPPVDHHPTDEDEELPEEFLLALGAEGEEKIVVGDPIRPELASRWKRIMSEGLDKESKESIIKKYPVPANFSSATAPILNPEIMATLSELSVKRDKRIVARQNLIGVLMTCLGKSLSNIMRGNINSTCLVEEINDAAKLAAEIHNQDSSSRKIFSLAGANKTVQEAVRQAQTDKYLFGEDCAEKIKAAQAIQKNSSTIKSTDKEKKIPKVLPPGRNAKQLNWKGPPHYQQPQRARGGQQNHQPPRKHYNQPHRKDRQQGYKPRSRYRRYN